jgi:hypothetical protein
MLDSKKKDDEKKQDELWEEEEEDLEDVDDGAKVLGESTDGEDDNDEKQRTVHKTVIQITQQSKQPNDIKRQIEEKEGEDNKIRADKNVSLLPNERQTTPKTRALTITPSMPIPHPVSRTMSSGTLNTSLSELTSENDQTSMRSSVSVTKESQPLLLLSTPKLVSSITPKKQPKRMFHLNFEDLISHKNKEKVKEKTRSKSARWRSEEGGGSAFAAINWRGRRSSIPPPQNKETPLRNGKKESTDDKEKKEKQREEKPVIDKGREAIGPHQKSVGSERPKESEIVQEQEEHEPESKRDPVLENENWPRQTTCTCSCTCCKHNECISQKISTNPVQNNKNTQIQQTLWMKLEHCLKENMRLLKANLQLEKDLEVGDNVFL